MIHFFEKLDNSLSIAFETPLERLSPRELILQEKMKEKPGPHELPHRIMAAEQFGQRIHEGHAHHCTDHQCNAAVSLQEEIRVHGEGFSEVSGYSGANTPVPAGIIVIPGRLADPAGCNSHGWVASGLNAIS